MIPISILASPHLADKVMNRMNAGNDAALKLHRVRTVHMGHATAGHGRADMCTLNERIFFLEGGFGWSGVRFAFAGWEEFDCCHNVVSIP